MNEAGWCKQEVLWDLKAFFCVFSKFPPFVFPPGWRSVRPQCGWPWGLPSPGLKTSFPPPVHPSALPGPLLYEACMLTTSFKYIRKQAEGGIFQTTKKRLIPYQSRHQRTKILPDFTCFKGEQRQKKAGKRTSCYTEVLYLGIWKQGCFHYFFFQRLCIFFCVAWIYAFLRLVLTVYIFPLLILEKTVLELFLPVKHTDVVALHFLENSC